MPPYRNPAGIFVLFSGDKKDKLSRVMQSIGMVAFSVAFFTATLGTIFSKVVFANLLLEIIVVVCGGGGFFLGILMFIGVGARVTGEEVGVRSLPVQILRAIWKTFLFLLLPALALALLLVLFVHPKS